MVSQPETQIKTEVEVAAAEKEPPIIQRKSTNQIYLALKRICDFIISCVALIVLSPLLLVVAILIRREDGGPATYICTRVGMNGKKIKFRKFRSMVVDSDNFEKYFSSEQMQQYFQEFKLDNDPRITKMGAVIRKTSIDELLQLVAVVKGEMSLVGPRPVVEDELRNYGETANEFLSAKPGLTGYWQVHGRSNATYEDGQRQALELFYVRNRSAWLDIKILFQTVGVVLKQTGAK